MSSINSVTSQVSGEELYRIRKQTEAVKTEEVSTQSQPEIKTDEYDKANPVGETAEGVYSVNHDESGNLKVDYKPVSKNEDSGQAQKSEQKEQPAQSGGSAPVTSSSSDDDDDELEELKQQRDTLKAQLNRASDESEKQALRTQLQSVEAEIISLTLNNK